MSFADPYGILGMEKVVEYFYYYLPQSNVQKMIENFTEMMHNARDLPDGKCNFYVVPNTEIDNTNFANINYAIFA